MRALHGQCHADAERGQRHHRRRAHTDENHLPEDRRDFEKLPPERRDQHPVKQVKIELKIIFQNVIVPNAQDDKRRETTKAETSGSQRGAAEIVIAVWGAHAARVLASASRRRELSHSLFTTSEVSSKRNSEEVHCREGATTNTRGACAPQ